MNPTLARLLLSIGLAVTADHGIYGGFNPQWVCPQATTNTPAYAQVTLTVGSAIVDGEQVSAVGNVTFPFPDDIQAISPTVPNNVVGLHFVAYCYVVDVNGLGAGSSWFGPSSPSSHPFDFVCGASVPGSTDYSPTPDGHPHSAIPYGNGSTRHALFVGSVVGSNIYNADSQCGTITSQHTGFSVLPFYRNGSQVIYDTATTCELSYTLDAGVNTFDGGDGGSQWCGQLVDANQDWDLGIPSGAITQTSHADTPVVFGFDFTQEGVTDPLPLSASQIILDVEGRGGSEPDSPTLCFMDPNVRTIGGATDARSCQSELMLDAPGADGFNNSYLPVTPFRTKLNIGDGGGGYGAIWAGGAAEPGAMGVQIYFDLSYRGYVEPERQLVPQIAVP